MNTNENKTETRERILVWHNKLKNLKKEDLSRVMKMR